MKISSLESDELKKYLGILICAKLIFSQMDLEILEILPGKLIISIFHIHSYDLVEKAYLYALDIQIK